MRGVADYTVAYDISSDEERGRVDRLLLGYGFRAQKSVFECRLRRGDRERLERELEALNLETGYVFIYRLQANAAKIVIGKPPPSIDDDVAYIL